MYSKKKMDELKRSAFFWSWCLYMWDICIIFRHYLFLRAYLRVLARQFPSVSFNNTLSARTGYNSSKS